MIAFQEYKKLRKNQLNCVTNSIKEDYWTAALVTVKLWSFPQNDTQK